MVPEYAEYEKLECDTELSFIADTRYEARLIAREVAQQKGIPVPPDYASGQPLPSELLRELVEAHCARMNAMTRVRMLIHRTGGRHDGQEWPGYLDTIDVPQWEADQLIAEGHAVLPDDVLLDRGYDVLKVAAVDYESYLKRADGEEEEANDPRYVHHVSEEEESVADFDNDFETDDFDSEVSEPEVKRPYANANKDEWVKYAVYLGADEKESKAMTKNALIEKFGS